jgi:hypothetical protein
VRSGNWLSRRGTKEIGIQSQLHGTVTIFGLSAIPTANTRKPSRRPIIGEMLYYIPLLAAGSLGRPVASVRVHVEI